MPTPTRLLADTLVDGGIDAFIRSRRADKKSWRRISKELEAATAGKVDVTGETIRSWSLTPTEDAA